MKNTAWTILGVIALASIVYAIATQRNAPSSASSSASNAEETILAAADTYVPGAYQHFSQAAYNQAIADGKTIILNFHADWCPTCRQNERIIVAVFEEQDDDSLVGFKVERPLQKSRAT